MQAENREPTIGDVLDELRGIRSDIAETNKRLDDEVKRWDERFFQLSRDTLTFTRAVVTTAAVVAVIVPIFRDLVPVLVDQFAKRG